MACEINEKIETSVRVWTLLELMQKYRLDMLAGSLLACQIVIRECVYIAILQKSFEPQYVEALTVMLGVLETSMKQADADKSLSAQIRSFIETLQSGKETRPIIIETLLKQIIIGVEQVLRNRFFAFVPSEQARFYMNLEQFGDSAAMFPSAVGDMLEAGSCYAAGRATACIFHCMRIVEHGLRHIAKELGINDGSGKKPCPVDYMTWEQVLISIDNKRKEVRTQVKSNEHMAKTIEYAGLAEHCSHLKDLWRNPTMHSRGLYSLPEALGVMMRTVEFMKLICGSAYAPMVSKDGLAAMAQLLSMTKELQT